MPQFAIGRVLAAGLVLTFLGVTGSMLSSLVIDSGVDMRIEPKGGTQTVGDIFTIDIVVESDEPVNVFKGNVRFNPDIVTVKSIDYNTSIADLWAKLPWYSNGDGTLNFIGGTTEEGGFTGLGKLITITFQTIQTGTAIIDMDEVRILQYNGLGTDADVVAPIDAIFFVNEEQLQEETMLQKSALGSKVEIVPEPPTTDTNGDGKQSIVDVSIFMGDLVTQNPRSDFNQDGRVSTADLSIILNAE